MDIINLNVDDTESLLKATQEAIKSSRIHISLCMDATRKFGSDSRTVALKSLEVLFSAPGAPDIDKQKCDVIAQYSQVLRGYSSTIYESIAALNQSWMNIDQGMGFLLLGKGRETDSDPGDIQALIHDMKHLRDDIPAARAEIANLSVAIQGSAGGLDGLEDDIAQSVEMLDRLSGELDHGAAVLARQIILAQRLVELIARA